MHSWRKFGWEAVVFMYTWKSHHIQTEKQGVSLHFFTEGLQTGPCSFLHWSSGDSVKWEEAATRGGCSKVTFTAGEWAQRWWKHKEKGWAEQHKLHPHSPPSIPPTQRNWSQKTPQIFFWPCKTLMFNVLASWKWEYQSLPSCSVKCSMKCSACGRTDVCY